MSTLTSIGAALFTDLSVYTGAAPVTASTQAEFNTRFGTTSDIAKIKNVREFPAVGTPANIVNVPVYGQKISQSIGGQADAPTLEVTINYVGSDWVSGGELALLVGDGISRPFRFALMNSDPGSEILISASTSTNETTKIGRVANAVYYFNGKMESLLVTPSLTDATTAKISISLQSPFYGAYSY